MSGPSKSIQSVLSNKEGNSLGTIYVAANAPDRLYDDLRHTEVVFRVAQAFSAKELVNAVLIIDSKDSRSVEDVALAYACTVALTFKAYPEIKDALEGATIKNLQWVGAIVELWRDAFLANGSGY